MFVLIAVGMQCVVANGPLFAPSGLPCANTSKYIPGTGSRWFARVIAVGFTAVVRKLQPGKLLLDMLSISSQGAFQHVSRNEPDEP